MATVTTPQAPSPEAPGTWGSRLAALGPGLLMASAAIGGSHLVSSTQAGALYQWQLIGLVVLANVLKYPFFRFGAQYTVETGHNLVEGYARRGRPHVWVFFILCAVSSVISAAGVGILSATILNFALPSGWVLSMPWTAGLMMLSVWLILMAGRFPVLDGLTKVIVITLTVITVLTVVVAVFKGAQGDPAAVPPSPWTLASLPFLVALVGWMPAPIEISALQSLWVARKQRDHESSGRDVLWDFNVGFAVTALLAVLFVVLGSLVQFGTGTKIEMSGGAYIPQLITMYTSTMGEWSRPLMALLAFVVMYGTVITVVDGYGRACAEALHHIRRNPGNAGRGAVMAWSTGIAAVSLAIILWFNAHMGELLRFAMMSAFVAAPVFAWLNFQLVRREEHLPGWLRGLTWAGVVFLSAFTLLFLATELGLVG
ncbi:Mn2+ and Fe2+ transporters of the NRAMP family [Kytococcus aerolatus]|uniref:Mn2+ and Fe2+ transporters of the NRAMP family n=1 Tax=Kytococcus aerolatus TaxID=592308 RepID=A0A212TG60_9MICO|nr:NRAMP family divalent metal transporter [Kytococcus aerolatus]SNC65057.1 Mn2+ and Fe2+ transporters of the NRAMP family [Kytococcus aerolatus]